MSCDFQSFVTAFRAGKKPEFPPQAKSVEYARQLDSQDELRSLRDEFIIPTKGSLKKKALNGTIPGNSQPNGATTASDDTPSIYFVGNSLGAQPKAVRRHVEAQFETWASIGVNGHFTSLENSPLPAWQDMAADCAEKSVDLVGAASASEVIYMNTLTVNLHLLMASFYRPTAQRHKIIAEWKPFPSDSYALASQIQWHNLCPSTSLIPIHPDPDSHPYISTERILALVDEHASSAVLLLLPGVQYYTGQLFDVARITAHARARGLLVGWDLAHAAGNVELRLHDWGVDFAVWCTYKYLNAGPGAIAGVFVHERWHAASGLAAAGTGTCTSSSSTACGEGGEGGGEEEEERKKKMMTQQPVVMGGYRHRLAGWYGADKAVRFDMAGWERFVPARGAAGFQVSNPSAIDLASLTGALSVFAAAAAAGRPGGTAMRRLRDKALVLTGYLEWLLIRLLEEGVGRKRLGGGDVPAFRIITPGNPLERGCQLSLLLREGILESVSRALAERGVVCDARKPDVIRVAPVPMYCRFEDVWGFVEAFREALEEAK